MITEAQFPNQTVSKIGHFPSANEAECLYFKRVDFSKTPFGSKLNLLCLHDVGNHHGSFFNFTEFVGKNANTGLTVNYLDLKGHGLSNGIRSHVEKFDEYCLDLVQFINKDFFPKDSKIVLMGSGLGALVILNTLFFHFYLIKRKIDGLILLNPLLNWGNSFLNLFLKFKYFFKNGAHLIKLPFKIDGYDVVDDLNEAEKFNSDPLVGHHLTLSLFREIQEAGKRVALSPYYINDPCLFLYSKGSKLIDSGPCYDFIRGIDPEILEYEGLETKAHDLLNCVDKRRVFDKILLWIEQLSKGRYA